jgi:hypothetical protein
MELTFNSRVIFVDEVALYQLDSQAGLSDSSSAHHDELVFSQKLCRGKALLAIGIDEAVQQHAMQRRRGGERQRTLEAIST